MNVPAT
ncbi:hypothetical protein D018_4578, partial [Vibrio parahaemolyticus VP2007-007]